MTTSYLRFTTAPDALSIIVVFTDKSTCNNLCCLKWWLGVGSVSLQSLHQSSIAIDIGLNNVYNGAT
ncbi:hypothetical protein ETB97_005280 [Aspergillus alliaceus]|nr:hypothetical protein ETB97_005280 [Aspergillus burnettii]